MKFLLPLFFFLLTFTGAPLVSAQEAEPAEFIVVAEVSVYNASVVQNQNTLTASFTIANDAQTVQPDIRYGMELWSVSAQQSEPSVRVHTVVADETIALMPEEVREQAMTADVPPSLSGLYNIYIVAETLSGMPLSRTSAGIIRLEKTEEGSTTIDQGTCSVKVSDDDTLYSTHQGVDVVATETLTMTCDVVHSGMDTTLTPLFVTTERSLYGEEVETRTGAPVSVSEGVQEVTFAIPTPDTPQAYDTTVTLYRASSSVSNTANLHYVVQGASATIQNITLDNINYQEGDTATASLFVTGIAGAFPDARNESGTLSGPVLVATLESISGIACAEAVSTSLTELETQGTAFVDVSFTVTRACPNATVSLEVKDDSGVLASHTAVTTASPDTAGPASAIAIVVLVIIAGVVIFVVTRVDKRMSTTSVVITLAVSAMCAAGFVGAGIVFGDPQGNHPNAPQSKTLTASFHERSITVSVSGIKSEYMPGEPIESTWEMQLSFCANSAGEGVFYAGMNELYKEIDQLARHASTTGIFGRRADDDGQNTATQQKTRGTIVFDAPIEAGEHTFDILLSSVIIHSGCFNFCAQDTETKEFSIHHAFPFTVTAPPGPVVTLGAQPAIVFEGDDTVLTWTPVNVSSCVAESNPPISGWEGSITADTQDSMIVGPLALVDPSVYLFSVSCIDDEDEIVEDFVQVFVEEKILPECSDGADNDGDGWVDEKDPGCFTNGIYDPDDDNEHNTGYGCSDGEDNDGDNQIDAYDPGCANAFDDDEFNTLPLDVPHEEDNDENTPGGEEGDNSNPDDINFSEF